MLKIVEFHFFGAILLWGLLLCSEQSLAEPLHNVVVILTDDQDLVLNGMVFHQHYLFIINIIFVCAKI